MRFILPFLLIFTLQPALAETERLMTVTGQGVINVEPDLAHINLGVQTVGKTANAALKENNSKMAKIIAELKAVGIEDRDIQTTNFSISPQWEQIKQSSKHQRPKIIGYIVSNMVNLRIRDLDTIGEVLDQVVNLGANSFHGIRFDISNRAELMDDARVLAVKKARSRAEILTEAAGVELGEILTISEGGGFVPQGRFAQADAMMAEAVPIAQGELEIRAPVSLTYELE